MAIEQSIQLVESLLKRYSVDVDQFKKDRTVLLNLYDDLNIMITVEEYIVYLTGTVGKVPKKKTLYYDILAENFKSAGHSHYRYAIEPKSEELLITLIVQSDYCPEDQFTELVSNFIYECINWMNILSMVDLEISKSKIRGAHRLDEHNNDVDLGLSEQFLKV